jgi:hypothetical protein
VHPPNEAVATPEGEEEEDAKTMPTSTIVPTTGNFHQVLLENSVDFI